MGNTQAHPGPRRDRVAAATPPGGGPTAGLDADRPPDSWTSPVGPHGVVRLTAPTEARPYYRITYRTPTGQRRQPSGGKDYATAAAKAALIEAELASAVGDGAGPTVAELGAAWLADMEPDWSLRHHDDQTNLIAKWLTPAYGTLPAAELTRDDIKTTLGAPANAHERRKLRAALGGMLKWGYDNVDPATRQPYTTGPRAAFVPAQARTAKAARGRAHGEHRLHIAAKLIPGPNACQDLASAMRAVGTGQQGGERWATQLWLMAAIASSCGIRQGELFAARPFWVDLAAGTLGVHKQLIRVPGHPPEETDPKWGRPRTTVLPEHTIWGEPLRAPLAAYMAGMDPHELLFPAQRGGWMIASNFDSRQFGKARKAAPGWKASWTWHSARHSFCSYLFASWEEERDADGNVTRARKVAAQDVDVAAAAGHIDTGVTRGMYVSGTEGTMDRLNAVLG